MIYLVAGIDACGSSVDSYNNAYCGWDDYVESAQLSEGETYTLSTPQGTLAVAAVDTDGAFRECSFKYIL